MDARQKQETLGLINNNTQLHFGWNKANPTIFHLIETKASPSLIPFTVFSRGNPNSSLPVIRLHYAPDSTAGIRWTWDEASTYALAHPYDNRSTFHKDERIQVFSVAEYLREAIKRMGGVTLSVESGSDFSSGINFILLRGAPSHTLQQ